MVTKKTDYRKVFRCSCGGYHYLDVSAFDDWDHEYSFGIVEMPPTFWDRLETLFTGRDVWVEVMLDKQQVRELVAALDVEMHRGDQEAVCLFQLTTSGTDENGEHHDYVSQSVFMSWAHAERELEKWKNVLCQEIIGKSRVVEFTDSGVRTVTVR